MWSGPVRRGCDQSDETVHDPLHSEIRSAEMRSDKMRWDDMRWDEIRYDMTWTLSHSYRYSYTELAIVYLFRSREGGEVLRWWLCLFVCLSVRLSARRARPRGQWARIKHDVMFRSSPDGGTAVGPRRSAEFVKFTIDDCVVVCCAGIVQSWHSSVSCRHGSLWWCVSILHAQGTWLARCSLSIQRKRYWCRPVAYPICQSMCVCVCRSGKSTVAKRLIG